MAMMLVISFLVALVVLLAERQGYIGQSMTRAALFVLFPLPSRSSA